MRRSRPAHLGELLMAAAMGVLLTAVVIAALPRLVKLVPHERPAVIRPICVDPARTINSPRGSIRAIDETPVAQCRAAIA